MSEKHIVTTVAESLDKPHFNRGWCPAKFIATSGIRNVT